MQSSPSARNAAAMAQSARATGSAGLGISTEMFLEKGLTKDEVFWRALSNNPGNIFAPDGIPLKVDRAIIDAIDGHYENDAKAAQAVVDTFDALMSG